jgi:hypothetical protein
MILDEIQQSPLRQALANRVLTRPVLAINGAAAATVATGAAVVFTIDGRIFNRAALSAQALTVNAALQQKTTFQSSFYVQPVSTTVYYTLVLNAAGTVSTIQGTFNNQTFQGASIPIGRGDIPDPDDLLFVPFGGIKVVTNGATTFTPGTTALDAAGLTVTYSDYAGVIPATAW